MMNGGEAADQMVSHAFKGGEVVLRLSGSAAKNLAVYLANALKEGGPSKGKTTLKRMIADGSPLTVQRIRVDEIPYFNDMAKKYGMMFVAIRDKQRTDGTCDIMFRADDAARVNRIVIGAEAPVSNKDGTSISRQRMTINDSSESAIFILPGDRLNDVIGIAIGIQVKERGQMDAVAAICRIALGREIFLRRKTRIAQEGTCRAIGSIEPILRIRRRDIKRLIEAVENLAQRSRKQLGALLNQSGQGWMIFIAIEGFNQFVPCAL